MKSVFHKIGFLERLGLKAAFGRRYPKAAGYPKAADTQRPPILKN